MTFNFGLFNFELINMLEEKTQEISNQLDCRECGALLKYAPGTQHLKCEYCGCANEIKEAAEATVVEEIDFEKFLAVVFYFQIENRTQVNFTVANVRIKHTLFLMLYQNLFEFRNEGRLIVYIHCRIFDTGHCFRIAGNVGQKAKSCFA